MREQRRHTRHSIAVTFRARSTPGTGQLLFTSADLSAGGTFLASDLLLEAGEALALELFLPGQAAPVRARARVAWVRAFPGAHEAAGIGVEFLSMEAHDRARLEALLSMA